MIPEKLKQENLNWWIYDVYLDNAIGRFANIQGDRMYCLISCWGDSNHLECNTVEFLLANSIS